MLNADCRCRFQVPPHEVPLLAPIPLLRSLGEIIRRD